MHPLQRLAIHESFTKVLEVLEKWHSNLKPYSESKIIPIKNANRDGN